jgi:hypothetical protein
MLAVGPKVCGFEPGEGDRFLRVIKIHGVPFFGREVNPETPCRNVLLHVKNHLGSMNINTLQGQIHHFLCLFLLLATE